MVISEAGHPQLVPKLARVASMGEANLVPRSLYLLDPATS
jgi:hypothetical protein